MADLNLDSLTAVAEAATPGPWFTHDEHGRDFTDEAWSYIAVITQSGDEIAATAYPGDRDNGDANANAAHIATFSPPTVLALIAEARDAQRLRAELASLRGESK